MNILAWASLVEIRAEEDGVPFQDDENLTVEKIKSHLTSALSRREVPSIRVG